KIVQKITLAILGYQRYDERSSLNQIWEIHYQPEGYHARIELCGIGRSIWWDAAGRRTVSVQGGGAWQYKRKPRQCSRRTVVADHSERPIRRRKSWQPHRPNNLSRLALRYSANSPRALTVC